MLVRRLFLFLAATSFSLVLFHGANNPASARETFNLEDFFVGKTVGRGYFESGIAGVRRDFTVHVRGTFRDDVLTLVEDFVYDDGERDRAIWKFRKTADDRYVGVRTDIVGTAPVRVTSDGVRFSYVLDVRNREGETQRLRFSDILYKQPDGTVYNRARVKKFGFPVGKVEVVFRRRG